MTSSGFYKNIVSIVYIASLQEMNSIANMLPNCQITDLTVLALPRVEIQNIYILMKLRTLIRIIITIEHQIDNAVWLWR